MILITGATGHLGTLVVDELLKRVPASQIVAGARSPTKASALAARGVDVRELDYDRPATIGAALAGVDRMLLISGSEVGNRPAQHAAVIDAAKRAGVRLVAYTSVLHCEQSLMLLAAEHLATERALRSSGLPFVLLRNGWYIENYAPGLGGAIQSGALLGAAGDGKVAPAARRDFAEAAAVVLTTAGHENKVYELAGDRALTLTELAAEIARASGKPVTYRNLPQKEYATTLASFGMPIEFAEVLADSDIGIARGELDDRGGDLRRLIGRPTTPVENVIIAAVRALA